MLCPTNSPNLNVCMQLRNNQSKSYHYNLLKKIRQIQQHTFRSFFTTDSELVHETMPSILALSVHYVNRT